MKIISVGPAFPLRGGIANFNTALCGAFLEMGHQCSIQSFSLQYPSFLFPGKTQFESGEPPAGLIIHSKINSINPFSWYRTARRIADEKPDLVIINHWMPFICMSTGTIARRIRKKTACKMIALAHNVVPHEKQPGWKLLSAYLLKACDGFVVLSRSVLDDLDLFTKSPFKIYHPHPVYHIFGDAVSRKEACQVLDIEPDFRYILFFGMIRDYKGLDLMIRAMKELREQVDNVRLVIAGEFYSGKEEYEKLIEELGLQKDILLFDRFVPSSEVRYFFSLADIVAQPYRSATQSGVTQIAYHFELPMLVTDVGGLPEIVPHGKAGYVCDTDPSSIAASLTDFFLNKRAGSFIPFIREEKRKFTWTSLAGSITDLYHKMTN